MGEARRRGTYEQRRALAIELRGEQLEQQREQRRIADDEADVRDVRRREALVIHLAQMVALGMAGRRW